MMSILYHIEVKKDTVKVKSQFTIS